MHRIYTLFHHLRRGIDLTLFQQLKRVIPLDSQRGFIPLHSYFHPFLSPWMTVVMMTGSLGAIVLLTMTKGAYSRRAPL